MAATNPTEYFTHTYTVYASGGGSYEIGTPIGFGGTVQDVNDYDPNTVGPGGLTDNLAQLGDIGPDDFTISNGGAKAGGTYLGVAQGPNTGFVFYTYVNKAKTYVLATDGTYGTGDYVQINYADPDDTTTQLSLCFVAGTRIRVARGQTVRDIAVENLTVGDLAVTASGKHRPITWLGHRDVDCAPPGAPQDSWPVRIRAGAFGVGACGADLPERDLYLSPGHPVLVGSGSNEHLVPIMCLINGTTIDRVQVPSLTYWHVELDQHDILLAEGLPAESFLDYGTRPWFGADAEAHALANPDHVVPGLGARCRPVAIDGPVVETERRRLDAAFTMSLAAASAWPTWNAMAIGL